MLPGGASFATTVKRREWRAVSGPWTTGQGTGLKQWWQCHSLHKKIYRKNTKKPSHRISFCTYVLLSFNRCIIAAMHSNQYKV